MAAPTLRLQLFTPVGDEPEVVEIWVDRAGRSECLAVVSIREGQPVMTFGSRKPLPDLPAREVLAALRRGIDLLLAGT